MSAAVHDHRPRISRLTALVDKPKACDINSGLSAISARELERVFGRPREKVTTECQPVTNPKLSRRIVTKDVGPFRVTGLDIAVDSLTLVFADVEREDPELYSLLSSAGMLCCRLVRGSKFTLSNHSYGTALDIKIGGELDRRGDDKVQLGLLGLYRFFHRHGWYWGAEYPTEDSMHWELAAETFAKLNRIYTHEK
jgi:hypothetical protein